jgi:hypothetical protein
MPDRTRHSTPRLLTLPPFRYLDTALANTDNSTTCALSCPRELRLNMVIKTSRTQTVGGSRLFRNRDGPFSVLTINGSVAD